MKKDLNLIPITCLNDIPTRCILISTEKIKNGFKLTIGLDIAIRKSFLTRVQIDRIHLIARLTKTDTFHADVLNVSRTAMSNAIWEELKNQYGVNKVFAWIKPHIRRAYLEAKARKGFEQTNKTFYAVRV